MKTQVRKYVEYEGKNKIKNKENETIKSEPLSNIIYGIVDKDDDDNEPQFNIEVLKRYSIENYIFDFIYLFFYLKYKDNKLIEKFRVMLAFYEISSLNEILEKPDIEMMQNQESLQSIIDTFSSLCKNEFVDVSVEKCPSQLSKSIEFKSVKYESALTKEAIVLKYPKIYLEISKDKIKTVLSNFFS